MVGKQVPEGKRYCAITDSSGGINAAKTPHVGNATREFRPLNLDSHNVLGPEQLQNTRPWRALSDSTTQARGEIRLLKKCSADLG